MDIEGYWSAVFRQDADAIRRFFHSTAFVNWHNTNEHFTVEEFIRANCEYPGKWDGKVEKIVTADNCTVTAARVFEKGGKLSFHVVSFFRVAEGKIASIDEYWGDDGEPPQWRQDKNIGTKITD